jgi:signal transduction histidine kinase
MISFEIITSWFCMRFDLKISQIGWILVGVPLAFELLFVGLLSYSVHQAELEIKRQEHAKDVVYSASSAATYATQCAVNVGAYTVSRATNFKELYQRNKTQAQESFTQLERLLESGSDSDYLNKAKEARAAANEGMQLLEELIDSVDSGMGSRNVLTSHGTMTSVKKIIDRLHLKLKSIARDQAAATADSPEREEKFRRLTEISLIAGVAANILIAFGLAFFFSRSIIRKINTISDNAARLPKGIALNQPLTGQDEIAHLDHVFHSMVTDLDDAKRMQQYLIAMVSHDLRSPLTSLQGVLTLLAAGAAGELPAAAKEKITAAESDLGRLIKLTNELLDTERLASGQLELHPMRCLLADIVEEAMDSVSTQAKQHGIKIVAEQIESGKAMNSMLEIDPVRIGQVLTNLLTNAIKYSPTGAEINIKAEIAPPRGGREFIRISIIDQGRGVPLAFQKTIFEKFKQVQESDSRELGGKGLGLAICKSIVEQHGGTIAVDSEKSQNSNDSKGSTFWFELAVHGPNRKTLNQGTK